jgi:hypothetical protein
MNWVCCRNDNTSFEGNSDDEGSIKKPIVISDDEEEQPKKKSKITPEPQKVYAFALFNLIETNENGGWGNQRAILTILCDPETFQLPTASGDVSGPAWRYRPYQIDVGGAKLYFVPRFMGHHYHQQPVNPGDISDWTLFGAPAAPLPNIHSFRNGAEWAAEEEGPIYNVDPKYKFMRITAFIGNPRFALVYADDEEMDEKTKEDAKELELINEMVDVIQGKIPYRFGEKLDKKDIMKYNEPHFDKAVKNAIL